VIYIGSVTQQLNEQSAGQAFDYEPAFGIKFTNKKTNGCGKTVWRMCKKLLLSRELVSVIRATLMIEAIELYNGIPAEKVASASFVGVMGKHVRVYGPGIESSGTSIQHPVPIARQIKWAWDRCKVCSVSGHFMHESDGLEQRTRILWLGGGPVQGLIMQRHFDDQHATLASRVFKEGPNIIQAFFKDDVMKNA
jgi:hypothetical protein